MLMYVNYVEWLGTNRIVVVQLRHHLLLCSGVICHSITALGLLGQVEAALGHLHQLVGPRNGDCFIVGRPYHLVRTCDSLLLLQLRLLLVVGGNGHRRV